MLKKKAIGSHKHYGCSKVVSRCT